MAITKAESANILYGITHNSRDKLAMILKQHRRGNFRGISKNVCPVCQRLSPGKTVKVEHGLEPNVSGPLHTPLSGL